MHVGTHALMGGCRSPWRVPGMQFELVRAWLGFCRCSVTLHFPLHQFATIQLPPPPLLLHLNAAVVSPHHSTCQVQLAVSHQAAGVVGIDLSGNPYVGSWASWEPALQASTRGRGSRG